MTTQKNQRYIIKYSNHLFFNNKRLAFRKKCLFDITDMPVFIPFEHRGNNPGWSVSGKWLSRIKAEQLTVMETVEVDVSAIQWNRQIELDECFNLEKL